MVAAKPTLKHTLINQRRDDRRAIKRRIKTEKAKTQRPIATVLMLGSQQVKGEWGMDVLF